MLRVKDFTWHPGYMELNEAELDEPMRGEVKLRNVYETIGGRGRRWALQ